MAPDDRAIVVGISRYPELGNLDGPENDARAFEAWLRSPSGGGLQEDHVDRILSSDFPPCQNVVSAKPTTEAVKEAIDKLHFIGESGEARVGRRLYLFMAGHGFAAGFRDARLLMANAAATRTGHHFPGPPYADWFRESAYFNEVVLLMDCCLENYKFSPLQPCHLDPVTDSGGAKQPVRYYYGLASQFGRAAREVRDDTSGEIRGVFTATVLDGLWQGPVGGGDVTGDWLTDFVRTHMPPRLSGQPSQRPVIDYEPSDDIVFAHCAPTRYQVLIHADPAAQSQEVEMCDGALNVLPPSGRSNGTWEWELGPGMYKWRYRGSGDQLRFLELKGKGRVVDVGL
ncbi:MAG TPA: hypothetical protein VGS19_17070 [Streptosporangiaceae bacterium]|nr:hypothetical protein [Streptosporangiaceae bacterium]